MSLGKIIFVLSLLTVLDLDVFRTILGLFEMYILCINYWIIMNFLVL